MKYSDIEHAIVATVSYFDIFEYPLTRMELWRWLYYPSDRDITVPLSAIEEALDSSSFLKEALEEKEGFLFLRGKGRHVRTRAERYRYAEQKFKRALRLVRLLRFVPFLRFVAVCNSLGYSNARRGSDIDFFIIAARNRIWTVRFCTVWLLKILRKRPRRECKQDKFCMSFFVSESNIAMRNLALPSLSQHTTPCRDIYFTYWFSQMSPLFDRGGYYQRVWDENRWIRHALPNAFPRGGHTRRRVSENGIGNVIPRILEKILGGYFGDWIEAVVREVQKKVMPRALRELSERGDTRVILSDTILKMHRNDRRKLYCEMWKYRISQVEGKNASGNSPSYHAA